MGFQVLIQHEIPFNYLQDKYQKCNMNTYEIEL